MSEDLWQALSPLQIVLWCSFFLLLPAWATWRQGHHYWIIFKHKAWWPPRRSFIRPDPLSSTFGNHCEPPSYVFPSLIDHTHIMSPMSDIVLIFVHLSTQLALVKLRAEVLKCKLWSPSKISTSKDILQSYTLVTNVLCILGVLMNS